MIQCVVSGILIGFTLSRSKVLYPESWLDLPKLDPNKPFKIKFTFNEIQIRNNPRKTCFLTWWIFSAPDAILACATENPVSELYKVLGARYANSWHHAVNHIFSLAVPVIIVSCPPAFKTKSVCDCMFSNILVDVTISHWKSLYILSDLRYACQLVSEAEQILFRQKLVLLIHRGPLFRHKATTQMSCIPPPLSIFLPPLLFSQLHPCHSHPCHPCPCSPSSSSLFLLYFFLICRL